MVEEAARATGAMKDQAAALVQAMARFQLDAQHEEAQRVRHDEPPALSLPAPLELIPQA